MGFYTFEKIKRNRKVYWQCVVCGRNFQKSKTVTHTVNPFNRNERGEVRSRGEVSDCAQVELDAWARSIPPLCGHCHEKWELVPEIVTTDGFGHPNGVLHDVPVCRFCRARSGHPHAEGCEALKEKEETMTLSKE